jgi:hypothetical protein
LDAGAIVDELDVVGVGAVTARLSRCPAGWEASFEVRDPAVGDLAVVHRLVAPTLGEARTAVPRAVRFLLGCPVDAPVESG